MIKKLQINKITVMILSCNNPRKKVVFFLINENKYYFLKNMFELLLF